MNLAETSYSSPTQDIIMRSTVVCVTNQRQCERLIKAGRIIADISKTDLTVINVTDAGLKNQDTAALEYLFEVSKQNNAVMSIQYSASPLKCIENFIRNNKAINVVTGLREGENSILPDLWKNFEGTSFFTVTLEGELLPSGDAQDSAPQGVACAPIKN